VHAGDAGDGHGGLPGQFQADGHMPQDVLVDALSGVDEDQAAVGAVGWPRFSMSLPRYATALA